jgi:hypothetical protein
MRYVPSHIALQIRFEERRQDRYRLVVESLREIADRKDRCNRFESDCGISHLTSLRAFFDCARP